MSASIPLVRIRVSEQQQIREWYLKDPRNHRVMSPRPHLLYDVGVRLCDLPLHPQRVGEVQLVQVGVLQEVLCQRGGVAQALHREDRRSMRAESTGISVKRLSTRGAVSLTCSAEFMKQVFPRLVRPQTPGCPRYESCSSTEFLLGEEDVRQAENTTSKNKDQTGEEVLKIENRSFRSLKDQVR